MRHLEDIQEIYDYLESEERTSALQHVIREVSSRPYCNKWTRRKGVFYDINFYFNDKYYFAIIPNKKWLLWYFRKPALEAFPYSNLSLERDFPPEWVSGTSYKKVNVNKVGELTIRLFGMRGAQMLTQNYLK